MVTLTTDFGEGSPYVAAMKGVILASCPEARLVDIGHSVPPFDVAAGAFCLWAAARSFPAGCVHLAVVDPGVGGARAALAVRAGGSFYVAPDNGLLDLVLGAGGDHEAVRLPRTGASATFEGRDVFAPAAAALACGAPVGSLGDPAGALVRLPDRGPRVVWIDRFGNLVTNLSPPARRLVVGGRRVDRVASTFSEAPAGTPFCYVGSMGFLEVGVREGRADQALEAGIGTPVGAI